MTRLPASRRSGRPLLALLPGSLDTLVGALADQAALNASPVHSVSQHVPLYRWMLDGPAYLSLSCQARAVLLEIARGHDGTNNGRLGLSVRRASQRCNIARGTAQRALVELQDRGFVDCMTKGAFSRKAPHATEWRLTWWSCDVTGELASKKFMSWGREKQNAVSKYPVAVSNQSQRAA